MIPAHLMLVRTVPTDRTTASAQASDAYGAPPSSMLGRVLSA